MSRLSAPAKALWILVPLLLSGHAALAQSIQFSTTQPGSVDGPGNTTTSFSDSDIVLFNPASGIGTIYLRGNVINDDDIPDIDALFVRANGNPIFSAKTGAAGFPFQDDMLLEYDVATDTLSIFYDFAGLITTGSDADIDAFHLLDDGRFLISNISDYTLDSQTFEDGDIVVFDPVQQTASLLLDEDLFDGDDDIRVTGVSMLANGNLLLSAFNTDTGGDMTLGGTTFGRGDLIEYNLLTGMGSLFLDVSIFNGATEDFDGVHVVVPLPAAIWMMLSGLGLFGWLRRPPAHS